MRFDIRLMILLSILGLLLILFWDEFRPTPPGLLTAIKKNQLSDPHGRGDITSSVIKYIPLGTSKDSGISYLKKNEFEIKIFPSERRNQEGIVARKHVFKLIDLIGMKNFGSEYVIMLSYSDDKLVDLRAEARVLGF